MSDNKDKYVFVKLNLMFGDADYYMQGIRIMPLSEWTEDVEKFDKYLAAKELDIIEYEDEMMGIAYVSLADWEVRECTEEQANTLKEFMSDKFGRFRMPTQFIPWQDRQ